MRKSSIILASAALLAILAIGIAAGRLRHSSVAAVHASPMSANAAADANRAVVKFASDPSPTPPFLVNDLAGQAVSSAAFPGKVVLLSFWATWCPPCRLEIPELIELQNRYKDKLQIVGVSMDDADTPAEVNHVKEVAAQMGINYPVVMASHEMVDEYGGVPALPTTFVLNTSGRIVQKHTGLYPTEDFDNEIRLLLNLPVNATIETFQANLLEKRRAGHRASRRRFQRPIGSSETGSAQAHELGKLYLWMRPDGRGMSRERYGLRYKQSNGREDRQRRRSVRSSKPKGSPPVTVTF
jgi:thiol-disulfide isomerase/thioredoxin